MWLDLWRRLSVTCGFAVSHFFFARPIDSDWTCFSVYIYIYTRVVGVQFACTGPHLSMICIGLTYDSHWKRIVGWFPNYSRRFGLYFFFGFDKRCVGSGPARPAILRVREGKCRPESTASERNVEMDQTTPPQAHLTALARLIQRVVVDPHNRQGHGCHIK